MARLNQAAILLGSYLAHLVPTPLGGSKNQVDKAVVYRLLGRLQSELVQANGQVMASVVLSSLGKLVKESAFSCEFYSRYFIVQKKGGGYRPILDQCMLNHRMRDLTFKMLSPAQGLTSITHLQQMHGCSSAPLIGHGRSGLELSGRLIDLRSVQGAGSHDTCFLLRRI